MANIEETHPSLEEYWLAWGEDEDGYCDCMVVNEIVVQRYTRDVQNIREVVIRLQERFIGHPDEEIINMYASHLIHELRLDEADE